MIPVAKGLNRSQISEGGSYPTGAAAALPVQLYELTTSVASTITIINNANHAFARFDVDNFSITGSADSNGLVNNSQQELTLLGNGTINGGLRTRTGNINASEILNFEGYNGLTATRAARNIGAASPAIDFSGTTSQTSDGIAVTVAQSTVDVTLGGSSGRDITLPAGDVDFTMTIGAVQSRTEGLFTSGSFDFTGLSTNDLQPIFGDGRPSPAGNALGTAFAGWFINNSSATITVRVTGTIATARTWVSHPITTNPRPSFSLVNNPRYTISFRNNNVFAVDLNSDTVPGGARQLGANGGTYTATNQNSPDYRVASSLIDGTTSGTGGITAAVTAGTPATLALTNVGFNTARGYYTYTWNAPAGGATIDITLNARQMSGSVNPGVLNTQSDLFTITRTVNTGREENGRTDLDIDTITFDRVLRAGSDGGLDVTYRFQATVPAGAGLVAIGATLRQDFNPPVTLVSNNSTVGTFDISFTNTNSFQVDLNASSTGGAKAINAGQTVQVQDNGPSSDFRITIGGRTIPAQAQFTSGTNLNVTATATETRSETVAAGNNDLSTAASERSLGQASAGGVPSGAFMGGVDGGAVRADAWYVRFSTVSNPADWEITGATVMNNRTGQTAGVAGNGGSTYFQGPVWLNNDGSEPNVAGRLLPSNPTPFPGGIQAGDTFTAIGCTGFRCGQSPVTSGQRTRSTAIRRFYRIDASNGNTFPITINSGSTGGVRVLPASSSATTLDSEVTSNAWTIGWDAQAPQETVNDFSLTNNTGKVIRLNSATGTAIPNGSTNTVSGGTASTTTSVPVTVVQRQDALGGTGTFNTDGFMGTLVDDL